jgi:hypothetical protein
MLDHFSSPHTTSPHPGSPPRRESPDTLATPGTSPTSLERLIPLTIVALLGAVLSTGCTDIDENDSNLEHIEHYIRSDRYQRLVFELDYTSGHLPRQQNEADIETGFASLLDKPGGVEIVHDEELEPHEDGYGWSFEELDFFATSHHNMAVDDDTTTIHVLFVDGHYDPDGQTSADDSTTLGLAWDHEHVVIFEDVLERRCRQSVDVKGENLIEKLCTRTELGVWTHEIGHVIGLVDNGLPMVQDHEDPQHEHHDHNEECVMYWAYETTGLIDELRGRLAREETLEDRINFDDACKADIAAMRDE